MTTAEKNNQTKPVPTLIVGLGASGLSCARFLRQHGEAFAVIDNRATPPALRQLNEEMPEVQTFCGSFDQPVLQEAQRIVLSPGVSLKEPHIRAALQRGAEVFGDIELFARNADAPVVAITGSNGKSTVTTLVGEMAKAAGLNVKIGGNLGTPALDLLRDSPSGKADKTDFYVLELSSFQLETTHSLNAHVAVVLNVSPDHMDRYADFNEYISAKQRIYHGDGIMVVNRDDDSVVAMETALIQRNSRRRVIHYTLRHPREQEFGVINKGANQWLAFGKIRLLKTGQLRVAGKHNHANALAALALGDAMRIPMRVMLAELRRFTGLPHRTQWVATVDGVNWYDDSKGTNVGATVAAVAGMPGTKILIAGGEGKGADFSPLKEVVVHHHVKAVVLIGRDGPLIADALQGVVALSYANNMEQAVEQARALAGPGDNVLLSPACASFDMFANYAQRGDVFAHAVRALQT